MIIYNFRKPVETDADNSVGVTGENNSYTAKFYIRELIDKTLTFSIHLRFADGSVNTVVPDNVEVDNTGTMITWNVKKDDIFVHGFFEMQIEGRNSSGYIFQTEIVRMYADESISVEDKEYENPNSETLKLREEAYEFLCELKLQQDILDENMKQLLATDITQKADKSELPVNESGYVDTDNIETHAVGTEELKSGAVTKSILSEDLQNEIDGKVNSADILNIEPSVNLISSSNGTQTAVGVTAEVSNNKITVSGTSTAAASIYIPLKNAVTLTAGLPYCLSLQNFSTANTGIVVYPCNGTAVLGSWLLSEASAMNKSVAVYTPTETATIDSIKLHIAAERTVDNSFNIQIEQNNKSTVWADPDNFASATIKDEYIKNKADKAETLAGYGITDGVSTEIFDYLSTQNLADIADTSVSKLGVNVNSVDNLITLSGTSNASITELYRLPII